MNGFRPRPDATRELDEFLKDVTGRHVRSFARAPWLVLAPHPDDETIGASWILRRARQAHVLYVTDGAPKDAALRSPHAPSTRAEYAALRAEEARRALAHAGIERDRIRTLGFVDQEAAYALVGLTLEVQRYIERLAPAVVVAPPYEGGHPDHDATAFAAHFARRLMPPGDAPLLLEMTSYHRFQGALRNGAFLPSDLPEVERVFGEEERAHKAEMVACFASQSEVLAPFGLWAERFRLAPAYDFRASPASESLHYESLAWPLTGSRWRALAEAASAALESRRPPSRA